MNSIFEKYKWLRYVICSFIVALGILIIVLGCLTASQTVLDTINIVLSVAAMILGMALLITSLTSETHKVFSLTFILGIALTALGITTLVARFGLHITFAANFIVYIQGIFLLVLGGACLLKAIFLIVYREKPLYVFAMFAVATAAIILGILALCFVSKLVSAAYILLGILLVAAGIVGIVFGVLAEKKKSE